MRKRTLVTAVIMFAAIGTGTAGAFSFGGGAFSFLPSVGVPVINIPILGNLFGPPPVTNPPPTPPPPSASCAQYGCATTTTILCPKVVIRGIIPATCTAFVRNNAGTSPPTGTVTFTAQSQTATCTLSPGPGPATSSCSVTLPIGSGFFIPVSGFYSGAGTTYAPSSGSTLIIVSL